MVILRLTLEIWDTLYKIIERVVFYNLKTTCARTYIISHNGSHLTDLICKKKKKREKKIEIVFG